MGMLIDVEWRDVWYDTSATGGRFVRQDSAFRNWVTADGAPGPTGDGGFPAEGGRYHLYVGGSRRAAARKRSIGASPATSTACPASPRR
jgi:glutathionyl-hydroquinone reductase